jgi:hypothetical protein
VSAAPRVGWRGTGRDGSNAQEKRDRGKGPGKPSGGVTAHPTYSSTSLFFPCPFCHDTTLQHHRLLSVTANVTGQQLMVHYRLHPGDVQVM